MTPIKDIPGFNRDIQGIENDDKIRRARSEKSHQDQELKKVKIYQNLLIERTELKFLQKDRTLYLKKRI